jgi:hemerythrin
MARVEWTPDLNTGVDLIDGQHQRIVEYINQVHDARQSRSDAIVGKIVNTLVEYTVSHFGFEEALMEDAGYQYLRPHKKVHELFIRRVADFQRRFAAGEDVTEELLDLLHRWLFSHIRNEDRAYAPVVKAHLRDAVDAHSADGRISRLLERFFR